MRSPKRIAYERAYYEKRRQEICAKQRAYRNSEEYRAKERARNKLRNQDPEHKRKRREQLRRRYLNDPVYADKMKLRRKKYEMENTDKVKASRRKRRLDNIDFIRIEDKHASRLKKYGVTREQYESLLKTANGKCPVCSRKFGTHPNAIAVDHCHQTGVVRGLICSKCNAAEDF
jgi:hypothetical protein